MSGEARAVLEARERWAAGGQCLSVPPTLGSPRTALTNLAPCHLYSTCFHPVGGMLLASPVRHRKGFAKGLLSNEMNK